MAAGVELEGVYVAPGSDADVAGWGAPVQVLAPGVLERVATTVAPQPALAVAPCRPAELSQPLELARRVELLQPLEQRRYA